MIHRRHVIVSCVDVVHRRTQRGRGELPHARLVLEDDVGATRLAVRVGNILRLLRFFRQDVRKEIVTTVLREALTAALLLALFLLPSLMDIPTAHMLLTVLLVLQDGTRITLVVRISEWVITHMMMLHHNHTVLFYA